VVDDGVGDVSSLVAANCDFHCLDCRQRRDRLEVTMGFTFVVTLDCADPQRLARSGRRLSITAPTPTTRPI